MRLRRVDLPAFGRPRNETNPDLPLILDGRRFPAVKAHFVDAPAFDLEHLHVETIDLEAFADVRHSPQMRQEVPAHGFETLPLDFDAEAIHHFVNAHLSAEDERSFLLLDDGFTFDVVLVPNLADDLLQQVLDAHQPGGAAVLIDDDGHLRLASLHLLEQL